MPIDKRSKHSRNPMKKAWPFDQPPNCAIITVGQVVRHGAAILHVTHDADDHGWQFLTLEDARVGDAMVVAFHEIIELDPSLYELSDLPPGWHAWRQSPQHSWIRGPLKEDTGSYLDVPGS